MTDVAVLRIFCNHTRQGEQTITRLIQSLWWQLVEKQGVVSNNLQKHYTEKRSHTNKELWAALLIDFNSTPTISTVYIVVDGLDELDGQVMRWLVTSLIKLPTSCHLLLTSRDLPVIGKSLTTLYTRLEINPHQLDLKAFIHDQCYEPGSQISEVISDADESNMGLYEEIEQTILQKVGNM
jgi:hypothetical protein